MTDFKELIITNLDKLRKKEIAEKETWKARAYAAVIKNLKVHDGPIKNIEDLQGVKGIGEKIRDKIAEIINTGTLKQAEAYNSNSGMQAIEQLLKVHGIGPTKAKDLVQTHGIKTLEDLKNHVDLLNEKQKMGLKYVEDFELRIPRKEMEKHAIFVKEAIRSINPDLIVEVVGSFRRGAKDSGDIDILITHPRDEHDADELLKTLVPTLEKAKYFYDTFALGNKKYLGVCKVKYGRHFRRIDLLVTRTLEFPFALLYFTGSQEFNIAMRNYCLEKGMSLSEYGLKNTKDNKFIDKHFYTEKDVFDYLGLQYVPPNERKGTNSLKKL